ncbi:MAG: hypothetical protein JSU00_07545 [Acidobacteria bacterium]|nr:hypothetical protein [Acidobacteriota bacterium]
MDVPEEPGAWLAAVLALAIFLLLFILRKGALSERQETGVWIAFTLLFFAVCGGLVRGGSAEPPPAIVNQAAIAR